METSTDPLSPPAQTPSDGATPGHAPTAMFDELQVEEKVTQARNAAMTFTHQALEAARAHPGTAAAVLLGTGFLLGSLMYRIAFQRPTTSQRIANVGRSMRQVFA